MTLGLSTLDVGDDEGISRHLTWVLGAAASTFQRSWVGVGTVAVPSNENLLVMPVDGFKDVKK